MVLGTSHDTPDFAADNLVRWWQRGRLQMESGFSLAVEGTRTEQYPAPPEHTLGLSGSLRFR